MTAAAATAAGGAADDAGVIRRVVKAAAPSAAAKPPGAVAFAYVDGATGRPVKDAATLERIRKLRIPPAYTDVAISKDPEAKVQAHGRDAKGRKQAVYSRRFVEAQRAKRFEALAGFEKTYARIRAGVQARLRDAPPRGPLPLATLAALVVRLMIACHFRIGSAENVAKHGTFGLTTLLGRHATVGRDRVDISYVGKKSVVNSGCCRDPLVVTLMRRLKRRCAGPDAPLFRGVVAADGGRPATITAAHVNDYLRGFGRGRDFTSKDLRTFEANRLFIEHFRQEARAATEAARAKGAGKEVSTTAWKRAVRAAVKRVALELHNTPAVARKDYIHAGLTSGAESDGRFRAALLASRKSVGVTSAFRSCPAAAQFPAL